jgi:hypothetical protein
MLEYLVNVLGVAGIGLLGLLLLVVFLSRLVGQTPNFKQETRLAKREEYNQKAEMERVAYNTQAELTHRDHERNHKIAGRLLRGQGRRLRLDDGPEIVNGEVMEEPRQIEAGRALPRSERSKRLLGDGR